MEQRSQEKRRKAEWEEMVSDLTIYIYPFLTHPISAFFFFKKHFHFFLFPLLKE